MNLQDALGTFLEESRELLSSMEGLLLAAEEGGLGEEELQALFRCAHTIKGSAGLFGMDAVVRFTHGVESLLDQLRSGGLAFSRELAALLMECRDHMAALVAAATGGPAVAAATDAALLGRLQAWLPAKEGEAEASSGTMPGTGAGEQRWHLSLRCSRQVLRHGLDPLGFLRYLARHGRIGELEIVMDALPSWADYQPEDCYLGFELDLETDAAREEIAEVFEFMGDEAQLSILPAGPVASGPAPVPAAGAVEGALDGERRREERRGQEARSIRIPAGHLDRLISQVGELVIAGAANRLLADRSGLPELRESTDMLLRLVEGIRDTALRLRMVPIGEVFGRFPRIVRDLAQALGKDMELRIRGAEVELDKALVERIGDPLMHMVRNAIDHGIEPAAVRLARGKPARGTLRLDARHESGSIVIEVSDDGGGLDGERILARAVERGLVPAGQSLSRQEIFGLIFLPGFSTAPAVTDISGRGVGMDVVRSTVEALRGSIAIESEAGQGTCLRICLPLTLAIIDGLQVLVGNAHFILPLEAVVECIDLPASTGEGWLNLRGELLPLLRTADVFDIPARPVVRGSVVVVRFGGRQAGIVVDRLLGECQAVIKPLGPLFDKVRGISGATILGSGEVALILDVPQLAAIAAGRELSRATYST